MMDDRKDMHITIQQGRSLPVLNRCTTCCRNYHCPFCCPTIYLPKKLCQVKRHLNCHFKRAVFHEGYTIHRCSLNCRPICHFHCMYCESTLSRKPDFLKHLFACKKKHGAQIPSVPTPAATVRSADTKTIRIPTATPTSASDPTGFLQRVLMTSVVHKKCPICKVLMNKRNLKRHIERKHTVEHGDVIAASLLQSECVDPENEVYIVPKSLLDAGIPEFQNKEWGENQHVTWESTEYQEHMEPSGSKCRRLSGALVKPLLDSVDCVLLDCDGVIWRGGQVIPGAPQVINLLKENGKRVFFVTNNSTKTRRMYADKLAALGFDASEEEVFGTAYCSAMYLKTVCGLEGGKVYLIGSPAMRQELEAVGIRQTGAGPDPIDPTDWTDVDLDPEVKAVLVGFDEHFSYMKLNRALQYLSRQGCLFVGTNRDTRLPLEGGKTVPGPGCLLQAVETAAQRQAQTVGKPNQFMFDCLASQFHVTRDRCLMVGARLDTDIMLGSSCGLKTLLTLTGVSTVADAEAHQRSGRAERQGMVPDYYVESIADLLPALQG